MKNFIISFSLLLSVGAAQDEVDSPQREWKNADATASFLGEFVALDGELVEVLKEGGRSFKIPLSKLHRDDQAWIESYQRQLEGNQKAAEIEEMGVFDNLKFGDSRPVVLKKLQESTLLTNRDDGLFGGGKTGIDGKFRTKKTVGDANCYLFFEFDSDGLSELSLRTEDREESQYSTSIQKSWKEMVELFTILYGKPARKSNFPFARDVIQHGSIAATHKWKLENGGEAILGPAINAARQFYVYVRISAP